MRWAMSAPVYKAMLGRIVKVTMVTCHNNKKSNISKHKILLFPVDIIYFISL